MKRLVERLEWGFRHAVVYPLFRLLFRNQPSDRVVELGSVKKLLVLRYDRIGDMIVTMPILRALKRRHPSLHIGVVTSPANAELIAADPGIEAVYVLHRNWIKLAGEVLRARRESYDVVLNFIFNRTTSGGVLANVIAPRALKVGQGAEKYRFYFNRLLSLDRSRMHMVEVLSSYVKLVFGFDIAPAELQFALAIDEDTRNSVYDFLQRHGISSQQFVVVNLSATDDVRRISFAQARAIVDSLSKHDTVGRVVLVSAPHDRRSADQLAASFKSPRVVVFPDRGAATLLQLAELIKQARCVVTPDTSVIHFASAVQTPVLGFFSPLQVTHEWLPYNVRHRVVRADDGKPVSAVGEDVLVSNINAFLEELSREHL
jgi:ADP-heptose:LPS heptosyltransferase